MKTQKKFKLLAAATLLLAAPALLLAQPQRGSVGLTLVERVADEDSADKPDPMKAFLEMFQRGLKGRKVGVNEREHGSILGEYRPVVEEARQSTVSLVAGRKQLALGTVVDSDGYVLTKASEVAGKTLRCVFPGGVRVSAEVVDVYEPLDLALVKVAADGLEPAEWADGGKIDLGTFLAAPGLGADPIAIGVLSVASRDLSENAKGFLGVIPVPIESGGVRLKEVTAGTPAAKAGLKAGDMVVEIDGTQVKTPAEFRRLIAGRNPGDEVKFKVMRGDDEKSMTAQLVSREFLTSLAEGGSAPRNRRVDRMNLMGGALSGNREGFTAVLQTDLTLEPSECGGPLVNLDGEVVGINIARGGRVKSYAVPVNELKALLSDLDSGKFTVLDLSELKRAVAEADEGMAKAEAALESARDAKIAADEALKKAKNGRE